MATGSNGPFPWLKALGVLVIAAATWKLLEIAALPISFLATIVVLGLGLFALIGVLVGWPHIFVRDGILTERRGFFKLARMHVFDIRRVEEHEDSHGFPRLIVVSNEGDEISIDRTFTQIEVDFALKHIRASRPDLVLPDLRVS